MRLRDKRVFVDVMTCNSDQRGQARSQSYACGGALRPAPLMLLCTVVISQSDGGSMEPTVSCQMPATNHAILLHALKTTAQTPRSAFPGLSLTQYLCSRGRALAKYM